MKHNEKRKIALNQRNAEHIDKTPIGLFDNESRQIYLVNFKFKTELITFNHFVRKLSCI